MVSLSSKHIEVKIMPYGKDNKKSNDKKYYRPMDSYPNKNKDSY